MEAAAAPGSGGLLPVVAEAGTGQDEVAGGVIALEGELGRLRLEQGPVGLDEAVDALVEGDVVVASNPSRNNGFWGELMTNAAIARGARGAIIDGAIRDITQIKELSDKFKVFTKGRNPLDSKGRCLVADYDCPIECAGVRVGIFGLCPQLEGLVSQANCKGVVYHHPTAIAQQMADKLRNDEKCDFIICLSHLGYGDNDDQDPAVIRATRGIDVVLGGHSHSYFEYTKYLPNADGREIPLDHQGKNGQFVGVLQFQW